MIRRSAVLLAALALSWGASSGALAAAGQLTVVSLEAVQPAVAEVLARFERDTGQTVVLITASPAQLKAKVHSADHPDLVIAGQESMNALAAANMTQNDSRSALMRVGVGVAIAPAATAPDLSNADAVKQALGKATSIAYADPSDSASGEQAQAVLQHLGLLDAVKPKVKLGSGKNPLSAVGFGEVALGLHPVNEILATPALKLAKALPAEAQQWRRFDVALITDAPNPDDAQALLGFLKGASALAILKTKGFEPPP